MSAQIPENSRKVDDGHLNQGWFEILAFWKVPDNTIHHRQHWEMGTEKQKVQGHDICWEKGKKKRRGFVSGSAIC